MTTTKTTRTKNKEAVPLNHMANAVNAAPVMASHQDVRQRAMLVNLTIHQWLASATDFEITGEVANTHGISSEMGRYQKNLLSKSALALMKSTAGQLRSTHNRYTLPWDEWGTRILSAKAFLDYNATMRRLIGEYEQLFRDEFEATGSTGVSKYEEKKREAKRQLNGAFKEADYPTMDALRKKYGAKVTVMPIPAGEDFRIDLGAEVTAQVRKEIEAKSQAAVQDAMDGLFLRMKALVNKFVEALKGEEVDAIRENIFTSIHALLDSLPLLNVTGDPAIDAFATEIHVAIAGLNAKELRQGENLRAAVLERADAILSKMNDFLG